MEWNVFGCSFRYWNLERFLDLGYGPLERRSRRDFGLACPFGLWTGPRLKLRRIRMMSVAVRADREGDYAVLAPAGPFDLAHATAVGQALKSTEPRLAGCRSVDVNLADLDRID